MLVSLGNGSPNVRFPAEITVVKTYVDGGTAHLNYVPALDS